MRGTRGSRWENGKKPVGYQSELALRFFVLAGDAVAEKLDEQGELPSSISLNEDGVVAAK